MPVEEILKALKEEATNLKLLLDSLNEEELLLNTLPLLNFLDSIKLNILSIEENEECAKWKLELERRYNNILNLEKK